MAFSTAVDADPDPTTQIPWPNARSKRSEQGPEQDTSATGTQSTTQDSSPERDGRNGTSRNQKDEPGKKRLSTWDLFNLSVSMAGAQIAWTVELGYGTPFLLSLGLSEQLTSLVWLAGPISGLIAQPVIGAISDSSPSRYRRRHWVVSSTVILVLSTFVLAYCQSIAAVFVDLLRGGAGDWDPRRNLVVSRTAIGLAVVSFYLLDFALNALQASLRNLLLDITPSNQLSAGNAWHGRMTHAGNIIGFGFGFLPLDKLPIIRLIGGDQFRKFCIVAMVVLVATVWITCFTQAEKERETRNKTQSKIGQILDNIHVSIRNLPRPVRRVCYVQVFAFMGWFPFLFYATTYVGQVMAYEQQGEPDRDIATRRGEFAMLLYSIVAVVAGTILPHLARRDVPLLTKWENEDEDEEALHIRQMVQQWQAEAARKGEPLRLPVMPFLLRNIWTGALLLFTLITFSTFFITKVWQATVAISLAGVCWAVACWVPFAIIMEFLKELVEAPDPRDSRATRLPSRVRTASTPNLLRAATTEYQPLLRRRSFDEIGIGVDVIPDVEDAPTTGGTILGIHNLAIVFPQFIVALVSSAIFKAVDSDTTGPEDGPSQTGTYYGKNGVAWVLRFGGLCTLVGALICRMVPPTRTEREMRRRLGEMRQLKEENVP